MSGMGEMAQMAALYKWGQQHNTNKNIKALDNSKNSKTPKENSVYKPKQCRWRDLKVGSGRRTDKGQPIHDSQM